MCHVVTRQCDGDLEEAEHYVFFVQMFPGDIPAALEAIATKYSTDWGKEGTQPCAKYEVIFYYFLLMVIVQIDLEYFDFRPTAMLFH